MSEQEIQNLFERITNLRVLVIGDVMLDSYLWGKVNRISPEAPVPVVSVGKKDSRLGGAANVALNFHALGLNPILCSVLGSDEAAKSFDNLISRRALSTAGLLHSSQRSTTVKTRVLSGHQQMIRIDEEDTEPLSKEDEAELKLLISSNLENTDLIVIEDYDKGVLTESLIEWLINESNKRNITICVDPKKRNFLSYKSVSLFKPNLKELYEGLKLDPPHEFDIQFVQEAAQRLRNELNASHLLVTLSEHGALMLGENQVVHVPAHKRDIYDVSGAGDTVIALASALLALEYPLNAIAKIANLAGGLVCEKVGVVPVDRDYLRRELAGLSL